MLGDSQASLSMLVAQALLYMYIVDLDNSMARELPATKEEVVAAEVVVVFVMVVVVKAGVLAVDVDLFVVVTEEKAGVLAVDVDLFVVVTEEKAGVLAVDVDPSAVEKVDVLVASVLVLFAEGKSSV